MSYNDLLRAVLILICINHIHSQYYDLFQAFQPFLQSPQPSQPLNFLNDFTTRRSRPKQKVTVPSTHNENVRKLDKITITDSAHESNSRTEKNKQSVTRKFTNTPVFDFNFFTTTQRAIRKTTKTPSLSHNYNQHKSQNQQQSQNNKESSAIVFIDDSSKSRSDNSRKNSKNSDSREHSGSGRDRSKPISRPSNRKTQNQSLVASNYESSNWYDGGRNAVNYYTTRPPYYETTKTYNYFQNNNKNKNTNHYTTHNPLLNRPGVKPAVVHGPPITNRPVTQRPTFEHKPQEIHFDDDLNVTPEVISGPDEDYMPATEKKRYIDIAERMCDKYKSLNMKQVQAIPLVPSPHPVRVNISSCALTVPLVVGGKVVSIQEFPHMALLGWKKTKNTGYSWKCGGSLLSNQFILTAAHCAYQDKDDNVIAGPPRAVQLGSSYLNDPKAVLMKVSSVTRHPKYKLPKAYNDLALVKMASTVTFSEMIKPACLGTPPAANHPIIATGWGKTEFGGFQSHELRSVSIPVWDISECHNALGVSIKLPYGPSSDSQICAGERSGGKDTCQGDSGGPAQIQDGCTWRVVAVTSVGRFCGAADTPAIYATVQRAFISAVVFGKEATQNNKDSNTDNYNRRTNTRDNSQQATNNNQGNGYNDRNNKKTNEQSSSVNTHQQSNNFDRHNNGRNDGLHTQSSFNSNTKISTTGNYGNNKKKNNSWGNDRVDTDYNQNDQRAYPTNNYNNQNQPNRNEYNNNNFYNYNSQITENYSNSYSGRNNNYYNPSESRDEKNVGGEYYNNYASNNEHRQSYSRQEDYISDGRSETYYNGDGNVWWT